MPTKTKIVIYFEERLRPIVEANLNPYGGRYWIEESWGKRFSTKEEDILIEKLQAKIKLAPCYQCGGDSRKCDCGDKLQRKLIEDGICPECGRKLPKPKLETREGGHSELITYCPCGATYKS